MECQDGQSVHLAHDTDQWRVLKDIMIIFQVPSAFGKFLEPMGYFQLLKTKSDARK
jgi:hypothetical protein